MASRFMSSTGSTSSPVTGSSAISSMTRMSLPQVQQLLDGVNQGVVSSLNTAASFVGMNDDLASKQEAQAIQLAATSTGTVGGIASILLGILGALAAPATGGASLAGSVASIVGGAASTASSVAGTVKLT